MNRPVEVSDAKQVLDELHQSEARFRAIFENTAVGIGIMGLDRRIIDANPALCRMYGRSLEELTGQTPVMVTHPEDFSQTTLDFQEFISGEKDYYESERRYVRKNGEVFWAHVTMSIIRDAENMPVYIVGMVMDIDDKKRAQLELRHSEERFRTTFESSAIGMGLLATDGKILEVNEAVCRMSGYTVEELQQRFDYQNVFPEDLEVGDDLFAELLEGGRDSYEVEKRYVRKNGEVFWTRLTISAVRNPDGSVAYLVGMIEDIDEQKKTWAELQESETRFRVMFENAGIGIGLVGMDRQPIKVNQALLRMTGYSAEELYQLTGVDLGYPEDAEIGLTELQNVLAGRLDTYQIEKRYVRKNGQVYWVRQTNSVVRTADGRPQYLVSMVEDIDAQKKIWAELQESEARFRAMFENTAIGMTLSTLDRHVLQMNEALTRITGYSLEDLKGLNPSDLAHPEDRDLRKDEFAELLTGKRNEFSLERRYFHKSGRMFWGRVTYSLVCDSDGKPCNLVGLMEDITEQKMAQERIAAQETEYRLKLEQEVEERTHELKQTNQQLEEEITQRQKAEQALADKAAQDAILSERNRLARDLHDAVTQTLFSASMIAEVLPELWLINPAEGERRLEELRQMTRGALAEMRTLLVELRPNSLVEIPLPDLLRQLCDSLIGRARLPIEFTVDGQAKIPADVQITLYRITQEALNNIVKHAKATKVMVNLFLDESIRLIIIDDGSGFDLAAISPDHLGLKIMCERAESISATCSIYSQPGEGTQISVIWHNSDWQNKG
jgi:PAS domain S-box-containing protein